MGMKKTRISRIITNSRQTHWNFIAETQRARRRRRQERTGSSLAGLLAQFIPCPAEAQWGAVNRFESLGFGHLALSCWFEPWQSDFICLQTADLRLIEIPRLQHRKLDPMRLVHFDCIHGLKFPQIPAPFKQAIPESSESVNKIPPYRFRCPTSVKCSI